MSFSSHHRKKTDPANTSSSLIGQNRTYGQYHYIIVSEADSKGSITAEPERWLSDVLQPLSGQKDIRLARLQHATDSFDDQLEIDIETWDLDADSLPYFCALSYTWRADHAREHDGGSIGRASIHYQGEKFSITRNLQRALGFLRSPDTDRYFWIDQLCIRQGDDEEKSRQIPLMRDIYAKAPGGVVAWLGSEDGYAPALLQFVSNVIGKRLWDDSRFEIDESTDVASGIKALIKFVSRPWFSRIWIVQEASSQKHRLTLQLNEFNVPFSALVVAVEHANRLLISQDPTTSVPVDGRITYYSFLRACPTINAVGRTGSETLQELVQKFCDWNGSEARDKIYAFLGLASDKDLYPAPDYSLPVQQIYRGFASIWMRHGLHNALATLTFAVAGYGHQRGQPSWTPNWNHFNKSNPVSPLRNNYKFRAGGVADPDTAYDMDGDRLGLKGVAVDKIVAVGEMFERHSLRDKTWLESARNIMTRSTDSDDEVDKDLGRLLVLDGQSSLYELSGEEDQISPSVLNQGLTNIEGYKMPFAFSSHGQTSTGGMAGKKYMSLGVNPYAATYESPSLWPKLGVQNTHAPEDDAAAGEDMKRTPAYRAYEDAVVAINLRQRVFRTEKGRVGIGNYRIAVSQEVVILQGARMPFVVRKTDGVYRLISEAYVRGIMHGEAVDGLEWEEIGIV